MTLEIISFYQILKSHITSHITTRNNLTTNITTRGPIIHTDNNRTRNFGINYIFKTASTHYNDLNNDLKILNKQQFKNNLKRIAYDLAYVNNLNMMNLLRYAFQNLK
jgi:hypothetical protein